MEYVASNSVPSIADRLAIDYTPPNSTALATLTRGLGWFSLGLGLGLGEMLAPRQLSRAIGVPYRNNLLLPLLGARKLVAGLGVLKRGPRTNTWVKSRVLGDLMDLSLLGAAFSARKRDPVRLAIATAAVVGITVLDIMCAARGR